MKRTNLLMKTFLLCALLAGSLGAWADDITVTYAYTSINASGTGTSSVAGKFGTMSVGLSQNTNEDFSGTTNSASGYTYNDCSIPNYAKIRTVDTKVTTTDDYVRFTITPIDGVTFTPTSVSLGAIREGTDGGTMYVYANSTALNEATLSKSPVIPGRNKEGADYLKDGYTFSYNINSVTATSSTPLYIDVCMKDIGSSKSGSQKTWGLWNVVVTGTYTESAVEYAIATNPVSATYNKDATPTNLSVVAQGGTTPYSYQWYTCDNNDREDNPQTIDGATSATYSPSTATAGTFYYFCKVTDSAEPSAELTSTVATITVLPGFNASNYDFIKQYDFTSMGNVAFTLEASSAGNIWNQANSRNMPVYFCTNTGLENLAVQAAYGEDSGNSGTYMRGWKIVSGSGLLEGNGAGRCAAIGGIKSGWVVEFNYTGNNFYTKNDGSDAGISKTLLWAESGKNIYRANADGMIGFELDKNNYIKSIKIYQTKIPNPTAIIGGGATWDFTSADKQTAAGTISVGSNTLIATDGSSSIIYYTNSSSCKWNNDGNGYYLYGSGKTSNSNGRYFILQISSSGVLSLTTTGNNGTYTIKKCANATISWNDGIDLTTITTTDNGTAVSGEIEYDPENPYLLVGFPDSKLNTQKIKWEPNTLTLTTTANMDGWRSFYDATQGYTVDDATKVYIATAKDESTVTISAIEDIPAGTPVILKTSGLNRTMILSKAASTAGDATGNLLAASTAGQNLSGGNIYRLGYGAEGVGFYAWSAASASADIVYINIVANNPSRALTLVFDNETTGVNASLMKREEGIVNGDMYDLQGRKVANPVKGLYIVNGKKVIIK